MRPAQQRLAALGLKLGLLYAGSSTLMLHMNEHPVNAQSIGFILIIFFPLFVLGLAGALLSNDRQLAWYRGAFFLPWSAAGAALALCLCSPASLRSIFFVPAMLGLITVVPGAPALWLIGALWIWWSDRRRMRSPARRVH